MKNNPPYPRIESDTITGDNSRLMALLAMATGALAMPQASNADIIFTDLSGNPISIFGTNNSTFLIDTLPGTVRIGFSGHTLVSPPMTLATHAIKASQKGGYVRFRTSHAFLALAGPGLNWNQIGTVLSSTGFAATAKLNMHSPDSFDHMYLPFIFKDTTQVDSPLRYGWVEISLLNPATGPGPDVTIFGYAYDDTGAHLATGVVPEPASMTLLALGALALGAKGLRSWRRNRPAANPVGMAR